MIPFIALAAAMGAGALNAKAASDQATADAEDLLTRAALERIKAQDALARGRVEEGRTRMAGSQALSQERTQAAAGNEVDLSSGTAASGHTNMTRGSTGVMDGKVRACRIRISPSALSFTGTNTVCSSRSNASDATREGAPCCSSHSSARRSPGLGSSKCAATRAEKSREG